MNTPNVRPGSSASQRRSQRMMLSVPLQVSGKNENGPVFDEYTSTLIVNAHGGLVLLKQAVSKGHILTLKNLKSGDEAACTVIDINSGANEVQEVGFEFVQANPLFWHVSFPPADWTPRSPEAKHFESKPGIPLATKPAAIKK
ncbi:MAG TPA: hypothetical protein VNO32_31455 [Candidatus Acidoferrum sp.]|nr:hypothetical protein [Candidatus Acidoferrum sp.]